MEAKLPLSCDVTEINKCDVKNFGKTYLPTRKDEYWRNWKT